MKKMFAFIVVAFLAVPFASLAQSPNLSVRDIPEDSVVVLSKEEADVPGYIHAKYAFRCLSELMLADYYGPTFDPKDQQVLQLERIECSHRYTNDYDSD